MYKNNPQSMFEIKNEMIHVNVCQNVSQMFNKIFIVADKETEYN